MVECLRSVQPVMRAQEPKALTTSTYGESSMFFMVRRQPCPTTSLLSQPKGPQVKMRNCQKGLHAVNWQGKLDWWGFTVTEMKIIQGTQRVGRNLREAGHSGANICRVTRHACCLGWGSRGVR